MLLMKCTGKILYYPWFVCSLNTLNYWVAPHTTLSNLYTESPEILSLIFCQCKTSYMTHSDVNVPENEIYIFTHEQNAERSKKHLTGFALSFLIFKRIIEINFIKDFLFYFQ